MKEDWNLPSDWEWTTLGEITDVKGGITLNKSREIDDPVTVPYLRVANVQRGHLNLDEVKTVEIPRSRVSDYTLQRGDILFNEGGDRDKLGRGWIWNEEIDGCCHQNHVFRARPIDAKVDSKFVSYWGNEFGRAYFEREGKQTTNLASINRAKLRALPIPLPPLPEQRRIVARIEELFSRLDAGIAALRHAKAQLQRYRQSVLAAAVTGQLTQAWREQHPDTEPSAKLLSKILAEREATWAGRGKYKPPVDVEGDLEPLPTGWTWTTLAHLANHIADGTHKTPTYVDEGVAFLSAKDVNGFKLSFDACRYIPPEEHEELIRRCLPKPGNVLVTKSGTIGRIAVVRTDREFSLFESVANVPVLGELCSDFIAYAAHVGIAGAFGAKNKKGVAVRHLHLEDLRRLPIPLPPLSEQHQIVAEAEARTTAIDHLEAELDRQITRSNRLRQSTLASAFGGTL